MMAVFSVRNALFVRKCGLFTNFRPVSATYAVEHKRRNIAYTSKEELLHVLQSPPEKPKTYSGFKLFCKSHGDILREGANPPSLPEITKRCAEQWKKMSESEKEGYNVRAKTMNDEKEEYNSLMNSFVKVTDVIDVVSDFVGRVVDERRNIKKITPRALFHRELSAKQKHLKFVDATNKWNALSDAKKKEYSVEATKLNNEAKKALREWQKKYNKKTSDPVE